MVKQKELSTVWVELNLFSHSVPDSVPVADSVPDSIQSPIYKRNGSPHKNLFLFDKSIACSLSFDPKANSIPVTRDSEKREISSDHHNNQ